MVDFSKRLNKGDSDKKTHPIDIYKTLDRKSVTGPLRPAQQSILNEWYEKRVGSNDIVIKLHTGEGKTLIGLLILQSKLNQKVGPCVFVCPNIYLVQQVYQEAKKFGIGVCMVGSDNEIPNEFLEGKKILITHIQKIFNGKSKFGLDNNFTEIGAIVLDDSHACIDSIRNSFTAKIPQDHEVYTKLLEMFEADLIEQGEGSFLDIKNDGSYDNFLPIPYWSWIDRKSEVLELLSKYKDDNILMFIWSIIKDKLPSCSAFISGKEIEIIPNSTPIKIFGSFAKAKQRILMSATTQDDSFFIKGLGFSIDAVNNPLTYEEQKWSGEKMILIPSLIDESLDREFVISKFARNLKVKFGIVALVSSFKKAELYQAYGSTVATTKNIFEEVNKLKSGNFERNLIIVNRYDGIDLPDEACRLLIIDSMPFFNSLADKYEEQCRENSDVINIKNVQKIEQGLGRGVRGETDYCVILVIGADLVKFVRSVKTNKYFSDQTKKQIELGFEIAEMAQDDLKKDEPIKSLTSLINQSINRDPAWKSFYVEEMDEMGTSLIKKNIYNIFQLEKNAEDEFSKGDFEKSCEIIQKIIDNYTEEDSEKGWYLQTLARYKYFISKSESNKLQKSAFQLNFQLLKPKEGISYRKIEFINENRIRRIKDWIGKFKDYHEFSLQVDCILSDFSFGIDSEKFEAATKEIGSLLGFISQRPDKEIKKGPDNLWGGIENTYFMIECKSEVESTREEINKHEAGQMNSHCGWFESEYGNAPVNRILIIPTKKLSYYSDFTHNVRVMRKGKLKEFKKNIKEFTKEFMPYNINEVSDEKIQDFLNFHKLDIKCLGSEYTEEVSKKSRV